MNIKWYDILIFWIKRYWKQLRCDHSYIWIEGVNDEIIFQCTKCWKIKE